HALTFYYAYARGKELVARRDGGKELLVDRGDRGELIPLRNQTGSPLVLEAMTDRPIEFPKPPPEAEEIKQAPEKIKAETFALYCKDKEEVPGWQWHQPVDGHEKDFLFDVAKLGDLILKAVKEGTARANAARLILNRLADLSARPTAEMAIRKPELEMLRQQYADLISAA